jgi:putative nucleotidyltransferase with HDIG domain
MTVTNLPWSVWIRSGEWRGSTDSSIPMLPALAHEAIVIAGDPNVTITQLARVVSKDPALATRVVHLANAAYCAPLQTVTTLTDAIVRMGTSAVRNLVIAACLAARGSDARIYGPSGRDQIDHAIGTAYMAHIVAEQVGWDRDEAFLAGLLHDIGKLLLLKLAHDYGRSHETPVAADELNDVIATDHAATGAALLRSLQFPQHLVEVVMFHHEPQAAPHHQRVAEAIYFADRLSHRYAFGCDRDDTPLLDDPVCARVAPSEEWIQSIDSRAAGLYSVARRILG